MRTRAHRVYRYTHILHPSHTYTHVHSEPSSKRSVERISSDILVRLPHSLKRWEEPTNRLCRTSAFTLFDLRMFFANGFLQTALRSKGNNSIFVKLAAANCAERVTERRCALLLSLSCFQRGGLVPLEKEKLKKEAKRQEHERARRFLLCRVDLWIGRPREAGTQFLQHHPRH